jgi:phosphoribosyl 1,2-cyclic phosphate phosphodiesterase
MKGKHGITITFLGTGTSQGVPVIACNCRVCKSTDPRDKRLRCSILIQSSTTTVVVDIGPDFRYQMLRENVKKLDAVLITHEHKDHVGGLDEVRAFNFIQKKDMDIYCTPHVHKELEQQFSYAFAETKYPGAPELKIHHINSTDPITIGDITFQPIEVFHYKLPVLGFRIHNFTYITDANSIKESEMKKIEGSEIFVLNALHYEDHISHYTVQQALEIMNYVKPRQGIFIHMSHRLGLHAEEEAKLPEFIRFAYDGMKIEI